MVTVVPRPSVAGVWQYPPASAAGTWNTAASSAAARTTAMGSRRRRMDGLSSRGASAPIHRERSGGSLAVLRRVGLHLASPAQRLAMVEALTCTNRTGSQGEAVGLASCFRRSGPSNGVLLARQPCIRRRMQRRAERAAQGLARRPRRPRSSLESGYLAGALVLRLGPGAAGGHGDLQRHPQPVHALHLAPDQLRQALALAGRDLEDQLVVDLEDHAAGEPFGGHRP